MTKPLLRLFYTDFWNNWDMENNYFTNILRLDYEIVITDVNPDIIIYSWEGQNFKKYSCIRIYYTPENFLFPKYKECDFSMSFEYWNDSRNLRVPNYLLYDIHPDSLDKTKWDIQKIIDSKKGFCTMVVSNPTSAKRNNFFHKLSKYKTVASGGKHLNNIGGRVDDKRVFLLDYKFNLCFENASHPGYTSEKLVEAMVCKTIPLYWGNPLIGYEFNNKSFFCHSDYASEDDMIEAIIETDKDDTKYHKKFIEPFFIDGIPNQYFDIQRVRKFLNDIIASKAYYKPVSQDVFKQKIYYPLGYAANLLVGKIKNFV